MDTRNSASEIIGKIKTKKGTFILRNVFSDEFGKKVIEATNTADNLYYYTLPFGMTEKGCIDYINSIKD